MRNFALRDEKGNEISVFTGKAPRHAALKAANRGYTDIKLRERGTKKLHVFTGEMVGVSPLCKLTRKAIGNIGNRPTPSKVIW
jgi:hypothetical protein